MKNNKVLFTKNRKQKMKYSKKLAKDKTISYFKSSCFNE